MTSSLRLLWTADTAPAPLGMAVAREGGRVLVWHGRQGLFLFDSRGNLLADRVPFPDLSAAACAGDGSHVAAISASGHLCFSGHDLLPRWERTLSQGLAVAVDSFGDRIAAADAAGRLHLFDAHGQELWHTSWPRPLRYLSFVAEATVLVGSSDFGLVMCCDSHGTGLWRDTPLTHTGSLSVSGDGAVIALARFSEGVRCYGIRQGQATSLPGTAPCRLADVSYDGRTFLTVGLDDRVCLRDVQGSVQAEWMPPARPVAVALSTLGDRVVVALDDGKIQTLERRH
jgi:hypothetical protein